MSLLYIHFEGQGGAAGFGKGSAKVTLASRDEGSELAYTINAQVGGKIAQVGQRLIDGVAPNQWPRVFSNASTRKCSAATCRSKALRQRRLWSHAR
jgi:carbon monoxide dehydrogenase subunit G